MSQQRYELFMDQLKEASQEIARLRIAIAAEKERADSWQENCEAERARDDQFDWVVGECTHGLIGSYSTCNGGNGCERSRFLHCCFCMKRDFNSKEQARKWERQCVVRGDQWETEKSRAEKAEKERDEFREECHRIDGRLLKAEKELAELKTPLKDWDARLAEKNVAMSKRNAEITALTEKLKVVGVRNKFLEQSISEHLEDCPIGSPEILGANP